MLKGAVAHVYRLRRNLRKGELILSLRVFSCILCDQKIAYYYVTTGERILHFSSTRVAKDPGLIPSDDDSALLIGTDSNTVTDL
jgi:hypothetical protein